VALDERAFFSEKPETRPGRFQCPKCRRTNDYSIRWVRRVKKDRLPPGADDQDRAKFAKLRDYLLRVDDEVTCKTCGKRFEIPSQHSLMFVDQLEGRGLVERVDHPDDRRSLRVTGTLGVLRAAAERGLVNVPELVARLKATNFYADEALLKSAFGQWLES
jgi:transcription elongation factor Elf1